MCTGPRHGAQRDARICVNSWESQLSGRGAYLTRDSKGGGILVGNELKSMLSIQPDGNKEC